MDGNEVDRSAEDKDRGGGVSGEYGSGAVETMLAGMEVLVMG